MVGLLPRAFDHTLCSGLAKHHSCKRQPRRSFLPAFSLQPFHSRPPSSCPKGTAGLGNPFTLAVFSLGLCSWSNLQQSCGCSRTRLVVPEPSPGKGSPSLGAGSCTFRLHWKPLACRLLNTFPAAGQHQNRGLTLGRPCHPLSDDLYHHSKLLGWHRTTKSF